MGAIPRVSTLRRAGAAAKEGRKPVCVEKPARSPYIARHLTRSAIPEVASMRTLKVCGQGERASRPNGAAAEKLKETTAMALPEFS
ncbi:MAG: hypothetical protein RIA10_14850, partial [Amphiplicatus sp.]